MSVTSRHHASTSPCVSCDGPPHMRPSNVFFTSAAFLALAVSGCSSSKNNNTVDGGGSGSGSGSGSGTDGGPGACVSETVMGTSLAFDGADWDPAGDLTGAPF